MICEPVFSEHTTLLGLNSIRTWAILWGAPYFLVGLIQVFFPKICKRASARQIRSRPAVCNLCGGLWKMTSGAYSWPDTNVPLTGSKSLESAWSGNKTIFLSPTSDIHIDLDLDTATCLVSEGMSDENCFRIQDLQGKVGRCVRLPQ